jgi:putative Mg2+ transporter-C (MgtC) family protein
MSDPELIVRLLVAAGLGGLLGVERELRHKPAGLRTQILIAVGAALFTMVSIDIAAIGGSADRIAAQVVTGVGFLGGGAILRGRANVHGLTTAATIWVNAAVGMAAGSGHFSMAVAATVITLIVLAIIPIVEDYAERREPRRRNGPPAS